MPLNVLMSNSLNFMTSTECNDLMKRILRKKNLGNGIMHIPKINVYNEQLANR